MWTPTVGATYSSLWFIKDIISLQKIEKDYSGLVTLPETNMAPENGWLEDYFPIVSGRVSII